ncbi:hypothetical protein A0J61_07926 [Choanephora cucurbitarum]|uniref:Uncharacterized protein n=1 Tax=Choanephora cucurbitarum TaxID=101091 RepID=A0A1C7N4K5_9FUNG|nr:hypothetical protein A0J61_07926 [Choanephora cucurbitarum]
MKKTKEKQATQHEEAATNNGFNYLPPSPPAQQKASSQELLQSPALQASFSLLTDDHDQCLSTDGTDSIDPRDCLALEDFESFIASREAQTSLPSPTTNSYLLSMQPLDFSLTPLLNNQDFDIDQDTIHSTDYALFPSLPDHTGD